MDNEDAAEKVWESAMLPEDLRNPSSVHARCGLGVDGVLNGCVNSKTLDNITAVLIGFQSFEKLIEKSRSTGVRNDALKPRMPDCETVDFDWDLEESQIQESESHRVMQKLLKPLEPVEEEIDELDTPLSEVIDVTHKGVNSRAVLKEPASHCSSATDRYASSSRRQSQLLEATDTQNLNMHGLIEKADEFQASGSMVNLNMNANSGVSKPDNIQRVDSPRSSPEQS